MKHLHFGIVIILVALFINACGPTPKTGSSATSTAASSSQTVKSNKATPVAVKPTSGSIPATPVAVNPTSGSIPATGFAIKPKSGSVPAAASTPGVSVNAPSKKNLLGIKVFLDFESSNFFPRVNASFAKPDGTPVANDVISEDGWGLSKNFKKVLPGEFYRLVLSCPEMAAPYFSKIMKFTGEIMPRFYFGSVKFKVLEELNARINNGIKVKITKQPEGLVMFDDLFKEMRAESIYGDSFNHVLVFEPGHYTYTVYDANKKDKLIICDENGDEATIVADSCDFTILRESPSVVIDLSTYVGIKKDNEKPAYIQE